MKCKKIDRHFDNRLGGRDVVLPIEVARHLYECPSCRELYRMSQPATCESETLERLRKRIQRSIRDSLEPVSPVPALSSQILALLAVYAAIVVLAIVVLQPLATTVVAPKEWIAPVALLVAGTGVVAYSLGLQAAPGSYQPISVRVLIPGLTAAFGLVLLALLPWDDGKFLSQGGLRCLAVGLGISILSLVLLWQLIARWVPLSGFPGESVGFLAGLAGATVQQLHCTLMDVRHQLLSHLGVLAISMLAGFMAGRVAGYRELRHHAK